MPNVPNEYSDTEYQGMLLLTVVWPLRFFLYC